MGKINLDETILEEQFANGKSGIQVARLLERKNNHRYIGMHNNGDILTVNVLVQTGDSYKTESMKITNFNRSEKKKIFVQGLCDLLSYRSQPNPQYATKLTEVALQNISNPQRVHQSITYVKKVLGEA